MTLPGSLLPAAALTIELADDMSAQHRMDASDAVAASCSAGLVLPQ